MEGAKFEEAGRLARMIMTFDSAESTTKAHSEVETVLKDILTNPEVLNKKLMNVRATTLFLKEADRAALTHAIRVAESQSMAPKKEIKMHVARTLNTLIVSLRMPAPIHDTVFEDPGQGSHLIPHGTRPAPFKK